MQIDVPSPAVGAPPQSSSAEKNILLEEKHLKLWNKMEKDAFKQLKVQRFILTSTYDPAILCAIGMDIEFDFRFRAIGWEDVWNIHEQGGLNSKLRNFYAPCKPLILKLNLDFLGRKFLSPGRSLVCF